MLSNKQRITKIINRKALSQSVSKTEREQTEIAERCLEDHLGKICATLDISIEEWNRDKALLLLILGHPKAASTAQKIKYTKYDTVYKTVKALNIKISPKYRWFTSISLHLKEKQQ